MNKPEKMIIYNLFPLLAGPFSRWKPHMSRAVSIGFNWIFVNPIQYPGVSGSIYSVKDFFRFNPRLIDKHSNSTPEEQVRNVMRTAREIGLNMMADLVINHCAIDSDLIKEHPDWFYWDNNGKIVHPSCDEDGKKVVWYDLARFNYQHSPDAEGLYRYFFKVIRFLMDLGFKGFRCDAAYQIPGFFWERLIGDVREIDPDIRFFAETLGCSVDETIVTARAGFDYIFNSSKWWDLSSHWCMEQYELTNKVVPSISFPESHDTPRLAEELGGNINGLKQRYLFSSIFSSAVMLPIGFEFGFKKRLHVAETRENDWENTDIDITSFIKEVNTIKGSCKVFCEDPPTSILYTENPQILVIWKASLSSSDEALIILNKDIYNKQYFHVEKLSNLIQAGAPLKDVSPEYRLDYISEPFSYDLRPGQGLIFVTRRNSSDIDIRQM